MYIKILRSDTKPKKKENAMKKNYTDAYDGVIDD